MNKRQYTRRTPVGLAKPFNITSVCKLDIISLIQDDCKKDFTLTDIKKLTKVDMEHIARKMSNDYLEQLFWSSLKAITEYYITNKKQKNE